MRRRWGQAAMARASSTASATPRQPHDLPGVIQASLKVGPGDVVGETAVTFDRAGDVVVAGPDTAAVQDALTRCATWFTAHRSGLTSRQQAPQP
ncbi:hypothetical protein [Streptomyces indiaensis]|uniref:hypothetical protein n=1 Tax=Streptomyces indiaensis TaxID=284033 RepID=UPI003556FD9C